MQIISSPAKPKNKDVWRLFLLQKHLNWVKHILYCKKPSKSSWNSLVLRPPKLFFLSLFQLVGILLILVGFYGKAASGVTSLPIIGGIIACGIILISLSVMGLIGAVKHHQVVLFFYMIIMFILFLIQFSIACSCLAVDTARQRNLAQEGWMSVSDGIKVEVQEKFNCCGFNETNSEHPTCTDLPCCATGGLASSANCTKCEPCLPKLLATIDQSFRLAGSLGLFFSFTEVRPSLIPSWCTNLRPFTTNLPFPVFGCLANRTLSQPKGPAWQSVGFLVNDSLKLTQISRWSLFTNHHHHQGLRRLAFCMIVCDCV